MRTRIATAVCLICVLMQQATMGQSGAVPESAPTRVYRASKNPDPARARDVAKGLGEGRHVVTRMHTGETYRGHIVAIDETQFSISLDHNKGIMAIPYADVAYLEQNLTKGAKILIGIGVGVGAVLAGLFIWGEICCE